MHVALPRAMPIGRRRKEVFLATTGPCDEKIFFGLAPLLDAAGLSLCAWHTDTFQEVWAPDFLRRIRACLQGRGFAAAVLDIRLADGLDRQTRKRAREVALGFQHLCEDLGISASAVLRDGHQPLGNGVGGAQEMYDGVWFLEAEGPLDLTKYCMEIGADFLVLTRGFEKKAHAKTFLKRCLISGEAVKAFFRVFLVDVRSLRSRPDCCLSRDESREAVLSESSGYVRSVDGEKLSSIRESLSLLHPCAGLRFLKKPGDHVEAGSILGEMFIPRCELRDDLEESFRESFALSVRPPGFRPLFLERLEPRHPQEVAR